MRVPDVLLRGVEAFDGEEEEVVWKDRILTGNLDWLSCVLTHLVNHFVVFLAHRSLWFRSGWSLLSFLSGGRLDSGRTLLGSCCFSALQGSQYSNGSRILLKESD